MSDLNALHIPSSMTLANAALPLPIDLIPVESGKSNSEVLQPQGDVRIVENRFNCLAPLYACLRAKHAPTAAHSLRVSYWASAWGLKHELQDEELLLLETAGLLHDIGKIGVADRLLQKADQLYEHEHSALQSHWEVGREIVEAANLSPRLQRFFQYLDPHVEWGGSPSNSRLPSADGERGICEMESGDRRLARLANLIRVIDIYDEKLHSADVDQKRIPPRELALAEVVGLTNVGLDVELARSFVELVLTVDERLRSAIANRWSTALDDAGLLAHIGAETPMQLHGYGSSAIRSLNDAFYRQMMDHIEHGVIFIDTEFKVLDWNGAAERLTGRFSKYVLHQTWSPAMAGLCDAEGYPLSDIHCPFRDLINNGAHGKQRLTIRTPNDDIIQITIDVNAVRNERNEICGGVMIIEDDRETNELEQKIQSLREKVCIDQLTNLANKGELNRKLPEFLAAHQKSNDPASVIICDIDYFKKINDTFSHQAGDEALVIFAGLLRTTCRENDFIARFGGEEFVILCSHCNQTEAKELAEELRLKLQRTPIEALRNHCLTASFGVATIQPEDTPESVLGRADRGLLIAKESGRDRVVVLGGEEVAEEDPVVQTKSTWMRWLMAPSTKSIESEIITNVPRAVTLEKLKGFVHEFNAVVQHVDANKLVIDIDCKTAPIPKRREERLGKFRLTLLISDVEMKVSNNRENVKVCTLIDLEVSPVRSRDRRVEAIRSQAHRLKTALQGYLVAHELNSDIEKDIVRRFNAPAEAARY